jgi:hypothetical protein
MFSEQIMEEYGALDDEGCWSSTELGNSVPSKQEARPEHIHIQDPAMGKKSRCDFALIQTDTLCMKSWLRQIWEMEKMLY